MDGSQPIQGTPSQGTLRLNFGGPIQLDAFVAYVSQRLGVRFQYTNEIGNRSVIIQAPSELPADTLDALLASVLRSQSLALLDSDLSGWKRIVATGDATRYGLPIYDENASRDSDSLGPQTQVFVLQNVSAQDIESVLKPFLSSENASLIAVSRSNVLVVSDFRDNINTIAELVRMVDRPPGQSAIRIYEIQHQSSDTLAEQVKGILGGASEGADSRVRLFSEPLGNRIVISGSDLMVQQTVELLERLDVSLGFRTEVYTIRYTTAERVDKLIKGTLSPQEADRSYQSTTDEEGNLLVVRAPPAIHEQVEALIRQIDTQRDSAESPIQFYKLKNASAIDVLYTLLALQEAYASNGLGGGNGGGFFSPFGSLSGGLGGNFSGAGILPTQRLPLTPSEIGNDAGFLQQNPNPLAQPTPAAGLNGNGMTAASNNLLGGNNAFGNSGFASSGFSNQGFGGSNLNARQGGAMQGFGNGLLGSGNFGGSNLGGGGVASLPGGARVSADIGTNSLIVVAPANVQSMYKALIESLDQRRPQVLIEAKVIAIDTTDDFTLGVEVSGGDRVGADRLFQFTSYGLSEVDRDTGSLQIIPGLGFNGTLIDPNVADVIVRALSSHSRARVLAAPKILVNDNSTGKLESVVSVPFTSVNASDTVATTSLGGNQQAGTIITATPHINENDHLQLEFDVEFSTFAAGGAIEGLPPPRQIDRVGSIVTIPDGKTVVVGGLRRVGETDAYSGIPVIENIPILRELTGRTDEGNDSTSFFLFIRPVILRDRRFSDLEFLSDRAAGHADVSRDYPVSHPILIP